MAVEAMDSRIGNATRQLREHVTTPVYREGYALVMSAAVAGVLGLVYWVVAARSYSPEDVGVNSAIISTMLLLSSIAQLNLSAGLIRFIPAAGASKRRLVAWSEWTKLGLVRDYEVPADKITVIPPGVNVHEWRRPTPRVPHAEPVKILFVGGDLERKGGLVLLEAFRALRHLGLELHLVTKDRPAPEPGVFVYNGLQANSQPLKDLYHSCDIFALPTFGDTFAMVLSEAGAAGMAIISTKMAAIPELVRNGETGLTVSPGDAASLSQALRDLATNPALRMTLGQGAMARVARHYDAPTNASLLLDLLKAEANAARAEGLAASR